MFNATKSIYGINLFVLFMGEFGGPAEVCKYLGVSERTVKNWISKGKVPRTAVLALFWESKYGRSEIFADQVTEIRWLYRRVCQLQEQYIKAKDVVAGLKRLHSGAENEAFFDELPTMEDLPKERYCESLANTRAEALPSGPMLSPRAKNALSAFEDRRSSVAQQKKA